MAVKTQTREFCAQTRASLSRASAPQPDKLDLGLECLLLLSFGMKTKTLIEESMTEYPCLVQPRTTVLQALDLLQRNRVRHLPVVDKGRVVGVLSERDLKQAELLSDSMGMIVSDVMTPNPYCVKLGTPLAEVTEVMADRKLGSAVILNELGSVVGIFTTTDALHVLTQALKNGVPSQVKGAPIENFLMDLVKFKIF